MISLKIRDFNVPDDLLYTKEHEWIRREGDACRVGVTDYAQKSLREIVFVDVPQVGRSLKQMESLGTVESVKAVSEIYSPVSGVVIEVNQRLTDAPELVNNSVYADGWIVLIRPSDWSRESQSLLAPAQYVDLISSIIKK